MKLNFFILQLALSMKVVICISQTTTLKLATNINCNNYFTTRVVSSVNIFALPSASLIFSKKEENESGNGLHGKVLEIPNLPIGLYRITFKMFETDTIIQSKFITLKAIPVNYVNLCLFDKSVDEYNPFIGITKEDSLVIKVTEVGCWDHIKYNVIFKKVGNDIVARMEQFRVVCGIFTKDGNEFVSKQPIYISKNKIVTSKQINDLVIAFSNTKLLGPEGCTLHTYYEIKSNKNSTFLEDATCINYVHHFWDIFQRNIYEAPKYYKQKNIN